jgi:hypothetical protein
MSTKFTDNVVEYEIKPYLPENEIKIVNLLKLRARNLLLYAVRASGIDPPGY